MIAEFVARDDGGNGDHVVLGQPLDVPPGDPESKADPADPVVSVEVAEAPTDGAERTAAAGRPRRPGPAGASSAPTSARTRTSPASSTETGAMVHLHPLGAPRGHRGRVGADLPHRDREPGDYRLFVQVRVDGFLHTGAGRASPSADVRHVEPQVVTGLSNLLTGG